MKILIVDDNEDNLVLQEAVLASHGYTVETADNGVNALEVAALFCPDMIISDILMPEMDGFDLCRAVRADKRLRKIPFVFYSASYTGTKDKELAMALGASRYIEKPIEIEEFVKIINEMVKEYEESKLTIPESPKLEDKELERMHEKVLVNKLNEKVAELQNEMDIRRRTERHLNAQYFVTQVLVESVTIKEAFPKILQTVCAVLEWDFGEIWIYDQRSGVLKCSELWHIPSIEVSTFKKITREITFSRDIGLPGRVFSSAQPAWISDIAQDKNFPRASIAAKEGLHGAFGFPILSGSEVLGTINFFSREIRQPDKDLLNMLSATGSQIGLFIKRKQAEEKVHMLSWAIEQSPATIIITDTEGKIEYVNPKFEQLTGYTQEEVLGKNPSILKSGETTPEEFEELWKTISSGNEWQGEFHNRKKSGEMYLEYASISPIRSEEGKITHFLVVKEDITERKEAEQALLESEEKFRTISATANDAIIMADNDGNVSYWNKAAEKMFGYSSEEATGKTIYETCIPDRFHEDHLRGFKAFKDTGQGAIIGKTIELTAINRDGAEFPIEFFLSAVKIKGKWNAVAIIRNITERLRIEEKLRVSYKMASLGRLSAGVFHEILNPVNIISSHIQLLLMEAEKGSKTEEDLKSVQEEIARIVKITDNLLRFSRKEAPGTEKIKINDLLEKIISLIEPDMKLDNIKFVRKFDDRLLQISGSKDELRQVFLNLTTNARDAMPDGGTITVSTENVTGGEVPLVIIKITDTGCGIDKDKIEFVFEPFFTTKAEGKGTGLGLSTSYGIIEDHGGVMSVESEVGKGATFTIDLPVKD